MTRATPIVPRRIRAFAGIAVFLCLAALGGPAIAAPADSTPATSSVITATITSPSVAGGRIAAPTSPRIAADSASKILRVSAAQDRRFLVAAIVVFVLFFAWIVVVLVYLRWAIYFYNENYGLSDHEWKVLRPEVYAPQKEQAKYLAIRASIDEREPVVDPTVEAPTSKGVGAPPTGNPYAGESFGLPPGTIRGTLALTAMIAFLLVEMLNIFAPTNLEREFAELFTVFEMVIAFYFGGKVLDVFNKRQETATPAEKLVPVVVADAIPAPAPNAPQSAVAKSSAPVAAALPPPPEEPALPSSSHGERSTNLEVNAAPPTPPPTGTVETALSSASPLARRVLALTASFETGKRFPDCFAGISGDFDGQGMSWGALQWNFGRGTLQPLWGRLLQEHPAVAQSILGASKTAELQRVLSLPQAGQLAWVRSLQFTKRDTKGRRIHVLEASWKSALVDLGHADEMIAIQTDEARVRYQKALANCEEYGCTTERAVAFFFDVNVQNGRVDVGGVKERILADAKAIPAGLPPLEREVELLGIVARRRSAVCKAEWREDVLSRKLAIARGKGDVHGVSYDLAAQYFIRLEPAGA